MATRLTFSAALLVLLSACYNLPSDGCPRTPCALGLVCLQDLCVTPTPIPLDAGPVQDASTTDSSVVIDAGPDPVCGNGILERGEDCDDGDTVNAGCIDCITEPFGSGFVLGPDFACSLVAHDETLEDLSGNGVACWGNNQFAQLGANPAVTRRVLPVLHPSGHLQGLVQLAAGEKNVCALTKSNRIWCWGSSNNLLLGEHPPPPADNNADPIEIDLRSGQTRDYPPVHQIAMGWDHACAIVGDERKVVCWGNIESEQLGIGNEAGPSRFDLAQAVQGPDGNSDLTQVRFLALGHRFSLAVGRVDTDGPEAFQLFGWGSLPQQEMRINGVWTEVLNGIATELLAEPFESEPELSVGKRHFCTRIGNSTHCAGNNESHATGASQAGRGRGLEPITVTPGRQIRQVWAFASGSCALLEKQDDPNYRRLGCWGDDTYSQMLDGEPGGSSSTLKTITSFGDSAVRLLAHGPFAQWRCAQLDDEDNSIYCWGRNDKGQTGQPYAGAISSTPLRVFLDASDQPRGAVEASPLMNCEAARDLGLVSGVYWVKHGDQATYQAYCDTNEANDGGGWSLAMELAAGPPHGADGTPVVPYLSNIWTTGAALEAPQSPQDNPTGIHKNPAVSRHPARDLRLELKPEQFRWAAQGHRTSSLEMIAGWAVWRAVSFNRVLNGQVTLTSIWDGGSSLSFHAKNQERAKWLGLTPDHVDRPVGNDEVSPFLHINQSAGGPGSESSRCWSVGFNQGRLVDQIYPGRLRLGVLTSKPHTVEGCSNAFFNFVGFGYTSPWSYEPSFGAMGTTPSGLNRSELWSAGRIWVR